MPIGLKLSDGFILIGNQENFRACMEFTKNSNFAHTNGGNGKTYYAATEYNREEIIQLLTAYTDSTGVSLLPYKLWNNKHEIVLEIQAEKQESKTNKEKQRQAFLADAESEIQKYRDLEVYKQQLLSVDKLLAASDALKTERQLAWSYHALCHPLLGIINYLAAREFLDSENAHAAKKAVLELMDGLEQWQKDIRERGKN